MQPVVLGARGSALAMRQAQIVQAALAQRHPNRTIVIKTIAAQADQHPERPLAAMSGEGIFVKELETALLERRIDAAVHSLKDLPLETPKGLRISAVLKRDEPRDALVSRSRQSFAALPAGSRIGTSSVRRQSQLRAWRQDVDLVDIRGNVDTRLRKLDEGRYDAIVVAACGLIRLGLKARITEYLPEERMLPEPGQGALAVEAREDDTELQELLRALDDAESHTCVEAERAFLGALGGGCRVPIAAYASISGAGIELQGAVVAPDGSKRVRGRISGPISDARGLGERLAAQLETEGAQTLLSSQQNLSQPPSGG